MKSIRGNKHLGTASEGVYVYTYVGFENAQVIKERKMQDIFLIKYGHGIELRIKHKIFSVF